MCACVCLCFAISYLADSCQVKVKNLILLPKNFICSCYEHRSTICELSSKGLQKGEVATVAGCPCGVPPASVNSSSERSPHKASSPTLILRSRDRLKGLISSNIIKYQQTSASNIMISHPYPSLLIKNFNNSASVSTHYHTIYTSFLYVNL